MNLEQLINENNSVQDKDSQRVNIGFSVEAEDGSWTVQMFDLKRNKEH